MRTVTRLMTLFAIFSILFSSFSIPAMADPAAPPEPDGSNAGFSQAAQENADLELAYHSGTGLVRYLAPRSGLAIPQPSALAPEATLEEAGLNFLAGYGGLFGLSDPLNELSVMKTNLVPAEGEGSSARSFVRYQQVYQGIPVMGGELIVQLDAKNDVHSVSGEVLPNLALDTRPRVSAEFAAENAKAMIAKLYGLEAATMQVSTPELWIYNPLLIGGRGARESGLVWRVTVTHPERLDIRELALLDARDGTLRLNFNQVDTAKVRRIYDNNNVAGAGLPCTLARAEGGPVSGIADVNRAYNYSGFTYDFYNAFHGRDGIDNRGMVMVNTTRYCYTGGPCPYSNAFWNGVQMVYGAGFADGDDVVGHELTHGVTEHESGLYYYMQSWAINEALSDIWGEFIDQTYTDGFDDDSAPVKWLMGEDIPIGAIRSMSDPTLYGDPDRMTSGNYYCSDGDNGGVHSNSGVANKATFLMTDGGTFNGQTVSALGMTKTAKIWYQAATNLLTSGSDYQDLGSALNQACRSLIGTAGISILDCEQVSKAVTATEMFIPPSCPANEAPLCNNSLFDSQFNGSSAGWYAVYPIPGWATTSGTYLETAGVQNNTYSSVATNNAYGDLDVSARMRRMGSNSDSNGLIVRGTPDPLWNAGYGSQIWQKGYWFAYTDGGQFSVWKWNNNTETMVKSWTASSAIVTGDGWNTLRVVASGPNFTFYINGTKVWEGADGTHQVGKLGLAMFRDSGAVGDLFSVDWATASGGMPLNVWSDNMENPISFNWGSGALAGTNEWRYPQNARPSTNLNHWVTQDPGYAGSGEYNLFGFDSPAVGDDYMQMAPFASRPAGKTAYLHFKHAYDFEPSNFDGGVVEYQTTAGGPWLDVSGLGFTHNGYTGVISACCSNPLANRSAFVGDSQGLSSSRVSLGSAGGDIRFRFRKGTDNSEFDRGWFIDDVRIYTCESAVFETNLPISQKNFPPGPQAFNSAFTGSMAGWGTVNGNWGTSGSYLVSGGLPGLMASVAINETFSYPNLVYSARLRRAGSETNANVILIRGNPTPLNASGEWDDGYSFHYANNGQYSIWKWTNGAYTALQGWTATPAILQSDEFGDSANVMTVITLGSTMYFYINGTLVQTVSDATYSSGRVGVAFYEGGNENELNVDWAYLYPWSIILAPTFEAVSPEQQALNEAALPGGNPFAAP